MNPILSRLGCNQGTCHGSAKGKNGFKLSLRGYDAIFDIRSLTDDHASRRISLASPEYSLMLLKPTGAVPHEGGVPFEVSDPYYQVLRKWILDGAKLELETPKVTSIDIFPKNPIIEAIGGKQQVRVVATFSDNTTRDVTHEAFVESGNSEVAKPDKHGIMTSIRRGEASILARYEGAYAATTLTVMGDRSGFEWQEPPKYNKIDELVAMKWKRLKILPSAICSDTEFIRRVTLDITGLPPSSKDVRDFLADKTESRKKREALIDKLIGSAEYVDHWTNKWCDLLQVNGKFLGRPGATAFRSWIREHVEKNTPYDQLVEQVITAEGSNFENPAASYYKILREPDAILENTTHLFLSIRFNCNKCHDHPFERWTQDQYYETSAFFARVGLKSAPESKGKKIGGTAVEGAKPLYEVVYEKSDGEVKHERTGAVTAPEFPYDCDYEKPKKESRRAEFAAWVTSKDNPYFAMSRVNRIWGYMTGTGIIEPLDDIRAGNPASNPELLNYLTEEFINSGFNERHIIKLIVTSRTYQLSIIANKWNIDDTINFSHAKARRLPAETLLDAIFSVTGSASTFPGVPKGTRASALPDVGIKLPDEFLKKFGRPDRESTCECERSNEVQLGPIMALISGPTVSNAINNRENLLIKLNKELPDDADLIEELYLRILNRYPTKEEIEVVKESWNEIENDHQTVMKLFKDRQTFITARNKKIAEERAAKLAIVNKEFNDYKIKIEPAEKKRAKTRVDLIAAKQLAIDNYLKELPKHIAAWEKKNAPRTEWHPLIPVSASSTNKDKISIQDDRTLFVTGKAAKGTYVLNFKTSLKGITGFRLEAIPDPTLKTKGPGLSDGGNFVITEFEVKSAPVGSKEFKPVEMTRALANFEQANFPAKYIVDKDTRNASRGWAISPRVGQVHWVTIKTKAPINPIVLGKKETPEADTQLQIQIHQYHNAEKHLLQRFRISVTTDKEDFKLSLPQSLETVMKTTPANRTEAQVELLKNYFLQVDTELAKRNGELAEAKKPLPKDPGVVEFEKKIAVLKTPIPPDPKLVLFQSNLKFSEEQLKNRRLTGIQDLVWVLINTPEFLFNH